MIVLLATICDTILFDLRYKTLYFLQQKGLNLTLLESIDLLKGIKTLYIRLFPPTLEKLESIDLLKGIKT